MTSFISSAAYRCFYGSMKCISCICRNMAITMFYNKWSKWGICIMQNALHLIICNYDLWPTIFFKIYSSHLKILGANRVK